MNGKASTFHAEGPQGEWKRSRFAAVVSIFGVSAIRARLEELPL
jgi:hypothetical protein